MPLREFTIIYCRLRDGWWRVMGPGRKGWLVEPACDHHVPVMWFTYGQSNTTIPEQRSVTTGCGEEHFPSQISPRVGRTVDTVARRDCLRCAAVAPGPSAAGWCLCKRAGEQLLSGY